MSSSISIPRRKKAQDSLQSCAVPAIGAGSSAMSTATSSASPLSPSVYLYGSSYGSSSAGSPPARSHKGRRPSLMSAAFSKAEHTVVNIGDSERPRLITCVKASQGFDWNQEIFLPSYADYHFDDLERKQDPVKDIIVTDEEIANMLPS